MAGARRYRAFYIEPGLADYSAEGIGRVLVQKSALDTMNSTFVGMPVVNFEHTDKEPEELFNLSQDELEEFADGVVAATGYDEETGWYWADMLIWDESTQHNLANGYSVSCAYDVTNSAGGGSYHNMDYQEEVLDGEYKHMAIVPNPRYENAWVIMNSKPGGTMFGKKKRRENMPEPEKEMDNMEMEEGYVTKPDGSQMSIGEFVEMYRQSKANENAGRMYNGEDRINVDGEEVSIDEMMNAMGMMKNPGDHDKMENESDEEEDMENAVEPTEEALEPVVDESRQNRRKNSNMNKVRKAASTPADVAPSVDTQSSRLKRGQSRYGSPVRQGGN